LSGSEHSSALFKGLIAFEKASFPKVCAVFGKSYNSSEEYCSQTAIVSGTQDLRFVDDEEDGRFLELFRNCTCGSTLLECFKDRRQSDSRRKIFGELMALLVEEGRTDNEARVELLNFLSGKSDSIAGLLGQELDVSDLQLKK